MPDSIIGSRRQGQTSFPILARIIDCGVQQNLQVYPDETAATKVNQPSNTKFWYTLLQKGSSKIFTGLKPKASRQQLIQRLDSHGIIELLQDFPGRAGDSFLIPAGRLHALGTGNLILEIARNTSPPLVLSNLDGTSADSLLQQAALSAIRFEDRRFGRISGESGTTVHTRRIPLVRHCPHFVVEEVRITDHLFDRTIGLTFHLLVCISGSIKVLHNNTEIILPKGGLCLIPAAAGDYRIYAHAGAATILRLGLQQL